MGLKAENMPQTAKEFNKLMPYVEVDLTKDFNEIAKIFSVVYLLLL